MHHKLAFFAALTAMLLSSCQRPPSDADTLVVFDPPATPCEALPHAVKFCIEQNGTTDWHGTWEDCFLNQCETAYQPALGIITITCNWEFCPDGLSFDGMSHDCGSVGHDWAFASDASAATHTATLTYDADECTNTPYNCFKLTMQGTCP